MEKLANKNIIFNMNNMVKAVAIICITAVVIFLLYHFFFSSYARCYNSLTEYGDTEQHKMKVKVACVQQLS